MPRKRLTVRCVHNEPTCAVESYIRGYLAKRRYDAESMKREPVSIERGFRYDLRLTALPVWLTSLLGASLEYSETVELVDGRLAVHANSVAGNVVVHMDIAPDTAGGTVVTCAAELDNHYRGVPLPERLVVALVRNRFKKERRRDTDFVEKNIARS